jgi:hypothetical protein
MRFVTAHDHQLQVSDAPSAASRGAVHEFLHHPSHPIPWTAGVRIADFGLRLADGKSEISDLESEISDLRFQIPNPDSPLPTPHPSLPTILFDPTHLLNPPAIEAMGLSLDRTLIVRPRTRDDLLWAMAECLKCPGAGTVIGPVDARLSRVEARKLQLAAEAGGTTAVLLRPMDVRRGAKQQIYAAATRWQVAPMPSVDRLVQRWELRLLHGHGGREPQPICLERHRDFPHFRIQPLHVHRQTDRLRPAVELVG